MTVPVRFAILRSIHFLYISRFFCLYIFLRLEQLITFLKLPVSVILLPTPSAWEFPPVYARSTPTNITFFCLELQCNIQRRCSHRTSCFRKLLPRFFLLFLLPFDTHSDMRYKQVPHNNPEQTRTLSTEESMEYFLYPVPSPADTYAAVDLL